ncbi:hypothetical protein BCR61_00940 [Xanthomonas oryzae pv. oryzae]|nr:hypothetical protein B9W05_19470 [Xanthomonas oryzae pv. oryzae]AXI16067.1 hypothetical protein CDO19_00920 [Xanthomonas oryzae pv. oryzae]AXI20017.1 hypothetical protein CDO11_00915 [Xanthomonas oryzae pv. oryzae]AXQ07730.1 hypothetical protein BCR61_00940 [Xanthomonas oryzae pv. oryzae]AXQ73702.1 hypothetical protein BXU03_00925 [Xanthomonas oryzae pv. oryzae]
MAARNPLDDGVRLCKRGDVVVVTVNHRLNRFGYLSLAQLGDAGFAGSGLATCRHGDSLQQRGPRAWPRQCACQASGLSPPPTAVTARVARHRPATAWRRWSAD